MTKSVATTENIKAITSSTHTNSTWTGNWSAGPLNFKTYNYFTLNGNPIVYEASCTFNFNGTDSTQQQNTRINNYTLSLGINYDKPLKDKKTHLSFGNTIVYSKTHNRLITSYSKKPENVLVGNELLSNDFKFYQAIYTIRAAVRHLIKKDFFTNIGLQQEYANTSFDCYSYPF